MDQGSTSNRTAKALEQSVYQAIMDHAPWPMVEVEGDQHLVRTVNAAFCTLLQKEVKAVLGNPLADLVPKDKSIVPLLDRVARSGEPEAHVEAAHGAARPIFWSYTCWPIKAGTTTRVGLMIQVTETGAFQQRSTAINEALLISSVEQHELTAHSERLNARLTQEIREREQVQELLRRNHETFFTLIEHAPFGIYVVDADSRIRKVNDAARVVFAHVDPLLGRDLAEAVHILWGEPFADEVISQFRNTLLTGIPFSSPDSTHQRRDIKRRESYDWRIERIAMPNGDLGVVCYFYDISALKKAQEMLQDADRHKSEFLATLAHELRNPLAPLRNGLELLAQEEHTEPTWDKVHGMMKRQLDQMVLLIDDLMDLSRITRGAIDLRMERLDLRTLLEQAVETVRPLVERKEHTLVLDLPETPVMFTGDAMRLAQVFNNLLTNAAKYTDDGGAIAVIVDVNDHEATVCVEDNGIGIAPDQQAKVFDMFAQVERASDRVQGGLGIGLSIVKHLVGMHGGRILARSEGLGKGSSFSVVLPVQGGVTERTIPATPITPASTMQPKRVLIVDDNEDAATMMAMLLTKLGHEVRVANNGEEALHEGARLEPDVVLMDLGMPVMDGYTACRTMRSTTWGAKTLIIALSGWGQPEDRVKTTAAGFDHHMVKPIDSTELLGVIAERYTP